MNSPTVAFVAGPPVWGENFVGRSQDVQSLLRDIAASRCALIMGQRRIGKSSLLRQARHVFMSETSLISANKIWLVPINGLLVAEDSRDGDLVESLLFNLESNIDCMNQGISKKAARALFNPRLKPLRRAESIFRSLSETGISVMFLVDDAEQLICRTDGDFPMLVRSWYSGYRVGAICASYLDPRDIVLSAGQPWHNFMCMRFIGEFNQEEALELLRSLSLKSGRMFSDIECLLLIDVLGRHPYYLQTAGFKLFADYSFARIPSKDRLAVIKEALSSLEMDLRWHIEHLFENMSKEDLKALVSIAHNGHFRKADFKALSLLERFGWVDQSNGRVAFNSSMIRELLLGFSSKSASLGERRATEPSRVKDWAMDTLGSAIKAAVEGAVKIYF